MTTGSPDEAELARRGVQDPPPWLANRRIERNRPADPEGMARAIDAFLNAAGFDRIGEAHLEETPARVAEAWERDLLGGHEKDPVEALGGLFPAESPDLVIVRDIEFFSSCPHHLLPYRGIAHVAYLPKAKAVGFSGIIRMVDAFAHRLTLQEWLTRDVASTLQLALGARGAACFVEATPMCVFARGVKRPCEIATSAFTGELDSDPHLRETVLRSLSVGNR